MEDLMMMSNATMFADVETSNFHFPDLKEKLEQNFSLAKMGPDLENFIKSINRLGKNLELSDDQKNYLIKFRQKAYDKKRKIKPDSGNPRKTDKLENTPVKSMILKKSGTINVPENLELSGNSGNSEKFGKSELPENLEKSGGKLFWDGIKSGMKKIDGEKLITKLPAFLINVLMTTLVSYLVWLQSFDLYKSSGFVSPGLCATGGIIMVLVFAAQYAIYKNWFALFLCLYVGGYEAYFMVTATINDENVIAKEKVAKSNHMVFLVDKLNKTREEYLIQKSRLDNPKSKVYKNDWFKKKFVNKAWIENENAANELAKKEEIASSNGRYNNSIILKILYRLGIVLLSMILIHQLVSFFIYNKAQRNKIL